jgi:hypothetical protein
MTHGTAVVNCTSFLQLSSDCVLLDFFMENGIEDIFLLGKTPYIILLVALVCLISKLQTVRA